MLLVGVVKFEQQNERACRFIPSCDVHFRAGDVKASPQINRYEGARRRCHKSLPDHSLHPGKIKTKESYLSTTTIPDILCDPGSPWVHGPLSVRRCLPLKLGDFGPRITKANICGLYGGTQDQRPIRANFATVRRPSSDVDDKGSWQIRIRGEKFEINDTGA